MSEDAEKLISKAIESVLEQAPPPIADAEAPPELPSVQPWAETAAPVGRNKRPLPEFLAELRRRVEADPHPAPFHITDKPASQLFFERLVPSGTGTRRRRRRRPGPSRGPVASNQQPTVERNQAEGTRTGPRRRRRRGGGRRPGWPNQSAPPATER